MTLKYRHITYEPDCSGIDCVEGEVGGRYRGHQWHTHYPRHFHVPQPRPTLRYRGTTYNMNNPKDQANLGVGITNAKTQPKTPSTIPRGEAPEEEWKQAHKANVCRVLERRRQRAEAQGDQQLLDLINSEAQQWVC